MHVLAMLYHLVWHFMVKNIGENQIEFFSQNSGLSLQFRVERHNCLRIHQRLFNVEISFAYNSFIIKDNIIKVYIIRKLVKLTIKLSLFHPQ